MPFEIYEQHHEKAYCGHTRTTKGQISLRMFTY